MSLARIVASNPSTARQSARALREAGYDVEIVPPGTPSNPDADIEFDADTNSVISDDATYVPGQREFVLKPLWRKLTARFHADRDVARAAEKRSAFRPGQAARVAAPAAPERKEEREARETALAVAEKRRMEKEEAWQTEQLRVQRERAEQQAARARELEGRRAEELSVQRVREEQEAARRRELEAQRAELRQHEEMRRQQELALQLEYEQQQLALKQQEEERTRVETIRRAEEADAARQMQLARQREEFRQQEAARRKAEEDHRLEVLRQRQDEEHARRAEAQRLLIEANKRREESARYRPVDGEATATVAATPTLRQYLNLRFEDWKRARAAKAKVARIDRAGAFAWRQAWPITAGVAAAFLLGWGIAVYHHSAPKATVKTQPPVLSPGQYAPYPVATATNHPPQGTVKPKAAAAKRGVVRGPSIAEDEVVVRHYYPQKNVTAQNRTPQRKKITDLQ